MSLFGSLIIKYLVAEPFSIVIVEAFAIGEMVPVPIYRL
jgi:hypothetical protein